MFDNIIGNDKQKQELSKLIENKLLKHAYIFDGNEGIGKFMLAKQLACEITNNESIENNADVYIVKKYADKKNISVEQIRQLQDTVYEKPVGKGSKVYIINDADTMSVSAQNCLLKTLEEPPQFVVIILVCSNYNLLLSTIKSRCNYLHFDRLEEEQILEYCKKVYPNFLLDKTLLKYFDGSIGKLRYFMEEKLQLVYNDMISIADMMIEQNVLLLFKKNGTLRQNKQNNLDMLDLLEAVVYNRLKENVTIRNKNNSVLYKIVYAIDNAKRRIKENVNVNLAIDEMLFAII